MSNVNHTLNTTNSTFYSMHNEDHQKGEQEQQYDKKNNNKQKW